MFFKNRCNITAVLVAGVLGVSMVTGLTACGGDDGTKVVFTTGFGKNEVFRIGDESCSKAEIMIYLTTIQNQYANVYGTEIWNTSLNGVTLEDNVKETVLARIAQIKTMYLLAKEAGTFDHPSLSGVMPKLPYPLELCCAGVWHSTEEKIDALKALGFHDFDFYQTLLRNPMYTNEVVEDVVPGYQSGGYVAIIAHK